MKICYLFPDILNVNGSRGNLVCLCRRAAARGVEVSVTEAPAGFEGGFEGFDLIYIGAGHGEPDSVLLAEMRRLGPALRDYAENGGVILAVCEGFDLLLSGLTLSDGKVYTGAGVLEGDAEYGPDRDAGNYSFDCGGDIGGVVAFKNTSASVTLRGDAVPLGLRPDGSAEGARYKNVFASHGHGPLLPKNPRLADAVLAVAGVDITLLDDELEELAHQYMVRRLS